MIIDCHGHYTTAPKALENWRNRQIAGIADSMRGRGLDAAAVAHFLDRVVFCLFAEDIGLLPGQLFTRIAENAGGDPATFRNMLGSLFANMASGGFFGVDRIRHFNGSLFVGDMPFRWGPRQADGVVRRWLFHVRPMLMPWLCRQLLVYSVFFLF